MTLLDFITVRVTLIMSAVDEVVNIDNCAYDLKNARNGKIDKVNLYEPVVSDSFFDSIDCWPHAIDSDEDHTCLKEVKCAPCTACTDMELDWYVRKPEFLVEVASDGCKHSNYYCKKSEAKGDLRNFFLLSIDYRIEEIVYSF